MAGRRVVKRRGRPGNMTVAKPFGRYIRLTRKTSIATNKIQFNAQLTDEAQKKTSNVFMHNSLLISVVEAATLSRSRFNGRYRRQELAGIL